MSTTPRAGQLSARGLFTLLLDREYVTRSVRSRTAAAIFAYFIITLDGVRSSWRRRPVVYRPVGVSTECTYAALVFMHTF